MGILDPDSDFYGDPDDDKWGLDEIAPDWLETSDETDKAIWDAFMFYVSIGDPRSTIEFCTTQDLSIVREKLIDLAVVLTIGAGGTYGASRLGHAGGGWRAYTSVAAWSRTAVTRMIFRAVTPNTVMLLAEVYIGHELYKTMTGNLSMQSAPDLGRGVMTHPFEGGDGPIYYPGKGLVDWVSGLFD
jgi:hypothetical protein